MDRMNKEELLKLLNSLKIDRNEFWLLSSSALVMRGIYPDAGDLDIAVTEKGLEELRKNYKLIPKPGPEDVWYTVCDRVECVCDGAIENLEYKPELVDGYLCQNIFAYLKYLEGSEREKDKLRIPIVNAYINEHKRCL